MAQTDIDLGTGAGNNDGDLVYTAFVATQANFDDLYGQIETVGDHRYFKRYLNLDGVSGNTEWEQVANAINALSGYTVPAGYKPLFAYVKPVDNVRTSTPTNTPYYDVYYYTVVQGQGYYGTGTPPSGVSAVTATAGGIVPLGSRVEQSQTDITTLGEIGATAIQTAVNASGTELVTSGFTVFRVERSGVRYEYVFNGDDDSYGASWESTSADNFIDLYDNGDLERELADNINPTISDGSDLSIAKDVLFKTIELTQDNATVTCPLNSTDFIPDGAYLYVSFSGGGSHTVSYPSTDGATSLVCSQGDYVKIQKRIGDEWIVKKYVNAAEPVILHKKVSLTASEIKNIGTTPIEVIAAPGTGKAINVISTTWKFNWGSVAFDNNPLQLKFEGLSSALYSLSNSLNQTADYFYSFDKGTGSPTTNIGENLALNVDGTDSTATGDSTMDIYLTYEIIDL